MAKVSGYGGYVVVNSTGSGASTIQHNSHWTYTYQSVHDDTTDSGTSGWTQETHICLKFESATLTIKEDDIAYPEAIGLIPGTSLAEVWFKRGADAIYDKLVNGLVESYSPDNDQQKARVIQIKIISGSLTLGASSPTSPVNPGE